VLAMVEIYKSQKHDIKIGIGIIKLVVSNRAHHLDIIREALSNSCSQEVEASKIIINIFYEPPYGWSISFQDDGIGMDYTGEDEPAKKGRLDRFLDLSYSGVMGLKADEFSYKGLGAKLMYLCKRLEIETKTENGKSYRVIVEDPYGKLLKKVPEKPEPQIYENAPVNFSHGTVIRVLGYDNGVKYDEYQDIEKLKDFLYFRTIVGCTIPERIKTLPKIILNTPDEPNKELELGYRIIRKEGDHVEGQKIGVIEPPIIITKQDQRGNKITIKLGGGYALKTGEFSIGGFGVAKGGLQYVWKGIPYFHLDFNYFRAATKLDVYSKFARFIVECEDVETNMSRSEISQDGIFYPLFEKALLEAFNKIKDISDYKEWVTYVKELRKKELAVSLNDRIEELTKSEQKWVYFNGELIHKVPDNEQDTRALLWKLEGMNALKKILPLFYFKTLEHTSQRGIDIIGEFQEEEHSAKQLYRTIEVENILENFDEHEHVPEQTALIIAWDSENKDKLIPTPGKPYKFYWDYNGVNLMVYLIRYFPGIEIKKKG
jgi:hypothetical protein